MLESVLKPNRDRIYLNKQWVFQQDSGQHYSRPLSREFGRLYHKRSMATVFTRFEPHFHMEHSRGEVNKIQLIKL